MTKRILAIDLDGTICEELYPADFTTARPLTGAKEKINELYEAGHRIVIYTARQEKHLTDIITWLRKHGIKYHEIIHGKFRADYYIEHRERIIGVDDNGGWRAVEIL